MATPREKLSDAFEAQDTVLATVQAVRRVAAASEQSARLERERLPSEKTLRAAFERLQPADREATGPIARGCLYGVIRGGFASKALNPKLRPVRNIRNELIGEMLFEWMAARLEVYSIKVRSIELLDPNKAVDWTTVTVRALLLANGITPCDPENADLHACRNPYPDDYQYVTTITAAGDFPRTIAELGRVYDPRSWQENPYAVHFKDVHAVSDLNGDVPVTRKEPIGETWVPPAIISEQVEVPGGLLMTTTLTIDFVVRPDWMLFTYDLGKTIQSPSTLIIERDFGYLGAERIPGRPGWCRVDLEKNVRFSKTPGSSGGEIGWGNLANLIAPDTIAAWLRDMRYMPCSVPS